MSGRVKAPQRRHLRSPDGRLHTWSSKTWHMHAPNMRHPHVVKTLLHTLSETRSLRERRHVRSKNHAQRALPSTGTTPVNAHSRSSQLLTLKTSAGALPPPRASTVSLKRAPVCLTCCSSSSPASSKALNASADSTSAHL